MKNRMKTRYSIGKVSSFLRTLKRGYNTHSEVRNIQRGVGKYPRSVKVGAGEVTARRSLPNTVLHKRNHRENTIVQA